MTLPTGIRKLATIIGIGAMVASLLGHVIVVFCLFRSWDAVAAVTVFPIWIWAIFGIAAAALALLLTRSKLAYFAAGIWVLTVLVGADERRSLIRGLAPTLHSDRDKARTVAGGGSVLRVATLNCMARNIDAVREVARFNPDIVFIQEAPSLMPLREVAAELWGEAGSTAGAWHCSILARGKLTPGKRPLLEHGTAATLELEDGRKIELMSIHLEHATTRWDLWRPSCWREHRDHHSERRNQLDTLLENFETGAEGRPRLFGGDFNAPPTSNLFNTIPDRYANAFGTAGKGLGNTFINSFPVLRIDHIYAGPGFSVLDARSARTVNSDHRMVIADVILVTGTPENASSTKP